MRKTALELLRIGEVFSVRHQDKMHVYKVLKYQPEVKDIFKQLLLERVSVDDEDPEKHGYTCMMLNEPLWLITRGFILIEMMSDYEKITS